MLLMDDVLSKSDKKPRVLRGRPSLQHGVHPMPIWMIPRHHASFRPPSLLSQTASRAPVDNLAFRRP